MSNKRFTVAPMFHEKLKENGYTFCGVFDNTGKTPNFVYSIGLTQKLGVELLVMGNIPVNPMYAILHDFIEFTKGLPVEGYHFSGGMQVNINGEKKALRIHVKDVTGEEWLDDVILNRTPDFNKVYQIYFGDVNNQLPIEAGNTDPHKQLGKPKELMN